jgi:hypothetical protein
MINSRIQVSDNIRKIQQLLIAEVTKEIYRVANKTGTEPASEFGGELIKIVVAEITFSLCASSLSILLNQQPQELGREVVLDTSMDCLEEILEGIENCGFSLTPL